MVARYKDRGHSFSGYWFLENGKVFGIAPYHSWPCGTVEGKQIYYCIFFSSQLDDKIDGSMQESADMAPIYADAINCPITIETLSPYAQQVVMYDRSKERTDDEIRELRGYLLCPEYAGSTFEDVCVRYPVVFTERVKEEGEVSLVASHWRFSKDKEVIEDGTN